MENDLVYNTQRETLRISEYGRTIQNMVEHLMEIPDRKRRTEAAYFLVNVMVQMNPEVRNSDDYQHKLWDHLYIISDFKLDVDGPFPKPSSEIKKMKPEFVGYHTSNVKQNHYGSLIRLMIDKAVKIEDEQKRNAFALSIAEQMKRDFLLWNRDNVNNNTILKDLSDMSNGKLTLPENTVLTSTNEILGKNVEQPVAMQKKKKRKRIKTQKN